VREPALEEEQIPLLEEMVKSGFRIMISGVFAYPSGRSGWKGDGQEDDSGARGAPGEIIDKPFRGGGEIETTVLDCPLFRKRLKILEAEKVWKGDSGIYAVKKAELEQK